MNRYTPLAEIKHEPDDRVNWQVGLPDYAPSEDIGLNLGRLGRFARLAGFEELRITSYQGETTSVAPDIDSVDLGGNITASGRASVTVAETHSLHLPRHDPGKDIPPDYYWTKGTMSLNVAEIDNAVSEQRKLRDPNAWSKQLDKAVRKGLRDAAVQNLLEKSRLIDKLFTPIAVGSLVVWNTLLPSDLDTGTVNSIVDYYFLYNFFGYQAVVGLFFGQPINERRWSMIMGYPVDRVLAANGLSRVLPIVKPVKK